MNWFLGLLLTLLMFYCAVESEKSEELNMHSEIPELNLTSVCPWSNSNCVPYAICFEFVAFFVLTLNIYRGVFRFLSFTKTTVSNLIWIVSPFNESCRKRKCSIKSPFHFKPCFNKPTL